MKNKSVGVQWSLDFLSTQYLNKKRRDSYREDLYFSYLHPFLEKYYSELNPFSLLSSFSSNHLQSKRTWFFQDGLVPLILFFKVIKPEDINNNIKIYIHIDFASLVPSEWAHKVEYYRMCSNKTYDRNTKPKKIFLAGIAYETLINARDFTLYLNNLVETVGQEAVLNSEVYAYLPDKRSDLWSRYDDVNIYQYSKTLFKKIKLDINFIEIENVLSESDFSETLYFELNAGILIKDSYLSQFVLSKGGGLLAEEAKFSEDFEFVKKVELSLYHGVEIFKLKNEQLNLTNSFLLKNFNTEKFFNEGWETWFKEHIKRNFSGNNLI